MGLPILLGFPSSPGVVVSKLGLGVPLMSAWALLANLCIAAGSFWKSSGGGVPGPLETAGLKYTMVDLSVFTFEASRT